MISILVNTIWHPVCLGFDSAMDDQDSAPLIALKEIHPVFSHTLRWDALHYLEIM